MNFKRNCLGAAFKFKSLRKEMSVEAYKKTNINVKNWKLT